MRKTVIAACLALASFSAVASDYFVVVPVKGRVNPITVALGGYALPSALQNYAYPGFDFNSVLQVSGDTAFNKAYVRWTVTGGALPSGLQLNADGTLTGTPTQAGTADFQVSATYKTKTGAQTYQLLVTVEVTASLADATLPAGQAGSPYGGFDFHTKLTITGVESVNKADVAWAVGSGSTLPAGLSLNSDGTLTGTPTKGGTQAFQVQAKYKTKTAQANYSMLVSASLALQSGGYRTWSDGSAAASCNAYRNPTGGVYQYAGATGDGVYRLTVGGTAYDVYCDMTTDGGGWTLAAKNNPGGPLRQAFLANPSSVMGTISNLASGGARLPFPVINTLFQASGGVALYKVDGAPYTYYKRLTNPASYDFASTFFTWSNTAAGTLNTDFKLYGTLANLTSDSGAWAFCNYDTLVTFPRDCGPATNVNFKWFAQDTMDTRVSGSLWLR